MKGGIFLRIGLYVADKCLNIRRSPLISQMITKGMLIGSKDIPKILSTFRAIEDRSILSDILVRILFLPFYFADSILAIDCNFCGVDFRG